jgi:hypothetical protein
VPQPGSSPQATSFVALGLRIFWQLLGWCLLAAFAGLIAQSSGPSELDAVYAATVVAMAVARYVDIVRFLGTTSEGEPATVGHFWRYVVVLMLGAGAAWGAAHLVGLAATS